MERPAILNKSMPSTAGATIRILAFQERPLELIFREVPPRDEERNLQLLEGVYQMGSGFSRRIPPSAHSSRRLLTRHLKTCLLVTLFTSHVVGADASRTRNRRSILALDGADRWSPSCHTCRCCLARWNHPLQLCRH